jgi:hypothetical protein
MLGTRENVLWLPLPAADLPLASFLSGKGATQKDVKNEDRSGDVYENKGLNDTMTEIRSVFLSEIRSFCRITRDNVPVLHDSACKNRIR